MMDDAISQERLAELGFWVDDWFVEPQLNRMRRDGETVPLEPKVLEVLLCLAERPGKTVTKEYFMEQVWTGTIVTDDVLSRCISELRKGFNDDARNPQFIETIRKTGYRLIAPVSVSTGEPAHDESTSTNRKQPPPVPLSPQAISYADLFALLRRKLAHEFATSRSRMLLVSGGLVVLLALLIAGPIWIWNAPAPATNAPLKSVPFTSFPGVELDPALSPDGKQVAFAWDRGSGGDADLYLKQTGAETPLRLTDAVTDERHPTWSPDGRHIAFTRTGGDSHSIFIVPSIGGSEQKVADFGTRSIQGLTWSPDGTTLIVSAQQTPHGTFSLYRVSIDGGDRQRLTTPPAYYRGDVEPSFSPGGKRLAFVRSVSAELEDLYVLSLEAGSPQRLTSDSTSITGVDWTPEGSHLIFASNRNGSSGLWKIDASGGMPTWIATASEGSSFHTVSIARTAPLLTYAHRSFDTNIWRLGRSQPYTTYRAHPHLFSTRWDSNPQIAPDGNRIAFASGRSGTHEIWLADRDGSNLVQLTSFGGPFTGIPRWSPDGSHLSFVSRQHGHADVYLIDPEGGPPQRVTYLSSEESAPAWSRDGQWLYFASNRSGTWQIWKMHLDSGTFLPVTMNGGRAAHEGPNGQFLYYVKPNTPGIWRRPILDLPPVPTAALPLPFHRVPLMELPERRVVADLEPADWGNWSVTDTGIYFVYRGESSPMLALYRFGADDIELITPLKGVPRHPSLAVAPDESEFLYTQLDRSESDILLVNNLP